MRMKRIVDPFVQAFPSFDCLEMNGVGSVPGSFAAQICRKAANPVFLPALHKSQDNHRQSP